jgi:molybdopterin/thiamine biosynthesis adenylyltransferase
MVFMPSMADIPVCMKSSGYSLAAGLSGSPLISLQTPLVIGGPPSIGSIEKLPPNLFPLHSDPHTLILNPSKTFGEKLLGNENKGDPVKNMLSREELERYDRQIMIWGVEGQEKLKRSTVAVVGTGGLGSPVAYYLAAAGVGRIILVDFQYPELSNLNRQILHWEEDIGRNPKPLSAEWKLRRFNSSIEVIPKVVKLTEENVDKVLGDADVIVDCLDDFKTRFIVDDYTQQTGKPLVHGAIEGTYGQATTIVPGKTKSLREIFGNVREKEGKLPIIGATAAFIASIQVMEVLKLLTGIGEPLLNKLLIADLEHNTFEIVNLGG